MFLELCDPIVQVFLFFLQLLDRFVLLYDAQVILLDHFFDHELSVAELAYSTSRLLFAVGNHGFRERSTFLEAVLADGVAAELAMIFGAFGFEWDDDA